MDNKMVVVMDRYHEVEVIFPSPLNALGRTRDYDLTPDELAERTELLTEFLACP
jgi:hypothetical protein